MKAATAPQAAPEKGRRALARKALKAGIDAGPEERHARIEHELITDQDGARARYAAEGRIAALAARGALTPDQAWAGEVLREMVWAEARALGVSVQAGVRVSGGSGRGGVEDRLRALEDLAAVQAYIARGARGPERAAVVRAVIGDGLTIEAHIGRRGRAAVRAMQDLREALDLATAWLTSSEGR
ncbi:hypothetical protein [Neomegalonema perideroedes]|uniref:hypothetical protein n=1 Tax=Neomegalonema perideroedes TaxID=217219 RepID=UPI0003690884|nr:hypothetical protein [Neomegalonema perideroedes]